MSKNLLKTVYDAALNSLFNYNLKLNTNKKVFSELNLDFKNACQELIRNGIDARNPKVSWHYHLFAAFAEKNPKASILEIGTYRGTFTKFLSKVFPAGRIITLDLPSSDPIFLRSYNRDDVNILREVMEERAANLDKLHNVTFIEKNSLEIERIFSPETFDLIWVDGDHLNPQVTLDIYNSIRILKREGFLCVDDVINKVFKSEYGSNDSHLALEFFEARGYLKNKYIFKRFRGMPKRISISRRNFV
jgi:predicted O-methyltransferase YrrM